MKIKTGFQSKIRKVIIIALCWTLFSSLTFINQYFFVYDLLKWKKLSGTYNFWSDFTGYIILGVFGGIVGGYILIFKLDKLYRRKSFSFGIINSGLLFVVIYFTFAVFGLFFMNLIYFSIQINFSTALTHSWNNLLVNIKTPSFFVTMTVAALLVSGTQFMLQVSDKFGPGILWKFITGRYSHPRDEERIFMFLDLKSSTSIAEKIGSKKYFELLKDVYNDITEPIINCRGEIYQYIGDEVVINWNVEKGLANNNCLLCFFMIEKILFKRKEYYSVKYDLFPYFKAGLHIGIATVGEIGVIKKDIVFSGDVLNTTSRIQKECNNQNVNILISSDLLERLNPDEKFECIHLGEILLKGKEEKISLNTIKIS